METKNVFNLGVIESLEAKIAPAGTVLLSTAGGVLTITGDAANNGVAILDAPDTQGPGMPGTGAWTIYDPTGTFTTFILNGSIMAAPFDIPAQNGIKANLGDAADRIDIIPSTNPSGMMVGGVLNLNMGKGDDVVNLGDGAGQQLFVGGAAVIDLGADNDALNVATSGLFGGTVSVLGGAGNDAITLANTGTHVFHKGLTIDMGAGAGNVAILSERFETLSGAAAIKAAGQAATSQVINLSPQAGMTAGALTIAIGAGDLSLDLGSASTDAWRIGAGLSISAGAGNDTVHLDGTITVVGAVAVDLKEGTNALTLDASRALQTTALTVKGGGGSDAVTFEAGATVHVSGALSLNLGAGSNSWQVDSGNNLAAASLSVQGGAGSDTVAWDGAGLTLLGNATLALGAGANSTTLAPTDAAFIGGNLSVSGTGGDDSLTVGGPVFRVMNHVTAALGDGSNEFIIGGGLFHAGGNLSLTGGKGDDVLDATNSNLIVGRLLNFSGGEAVTGNELNLAVGAGTLGAVAFKGGNGMDALVLGDPGGSATSLLSITGAVTGTLGGGNANASITDTVIHGGLNLTLASLAGQSDSVVLNQSTVNGAVLITQGAGGSSLSVQDSLLRSALTANFGAGADSVLLDTAAGTAALNTWFGTVRINAGAGADAITLGSTPPVPNAGNAFYKNVFVDGGADLDILIQGNNTFFAGSTLTQSSIP